MTNAKKSLIFVRQNQAKVAQLVEHNLAKVGVASSNLVFRSKSSDKSELFLFLQMLVFNPQKGLKPILSIYGFLTLILIPTFIILIVTDTSLFEWITFLLFTYTFVALMYLVSQYTTRYWIENQTFFYKALFLKGQINILSIRKIEVNATCWQNGKPATSNTKGIFIYFDKYSDTFVTPENNTELVEELLKINPSIEVVYTKE